MRSDLQTYRELLESPVTQKHARLFEMAMHFKTHELVSSTESVLDIKQTQSILNAVQTRLAQNIALDKTLMAVVTSVCKELIFDPTRTIFGNDQLRPIVVAQLQKYQASNGFGQVFRDATPATLKSITSVAGKEVSNAKNYFRKNIIRCKTKCLTTAASEISMKMVRNPKAANVPWAIRLLIIRQFCRDRPELCADKEDKGDGEGANEARHNFWNQFEKTLADKCKVYGSDLKSPGWTSFINHALEQERISFPNDDMPLIPRQQQVAPVAPQLDSEVNIPPVQSPHHSTQRPICPLPRRVGTPNVPSLSSVLHGSTSSFGAGPESSYSGIPPLRMNQTTWSSSSNNLPPFSSLSGDRNRLFTETNSVTRSYV